MTQKIDLNQCLIKFPLITFEESAVSTKQIIALAQHYARTAIELHRGGERLSAGLLFEVSKLLVARAHLSGA